MARTDALCQSLDHSPVAKSRLGVKPADDVEIGSQITYKNPARAIRTGVMVVEVW